MNQAFDRIAGWAAQRAGSSAAFAVLIATYLIWGLSGPVLSFSDTWQLIANTTTTLLTTGLVILVQNTQNRNDKALHTKLDGIIAVLDTSNQLERIEQMTEQEIDQLHDEIVDSE